MSEVPRTQRGRRNFPVSKPLARESVVVANLTDFKDMFSWQRKSDPREIDGGSGYPSSRSVA